MKNNYLNIGFVIIVIYILPYIILGENAYITIHDFLDQNVVIMADLKNNHLLTSITGIVPNMGGLDRSLFPFFTPFDVKMLSYALLPTFWAIVIYTFVYKLIAYLGMFLLLNTYVMNRKYRLMTMLISLGFAFVPFYMELGLSGAGCPLVAYAFLNLYFNQYKVWSYAAISFYTFNSLLAYGGFFFLVVLSLCLIFDYNKTKKIPPYVILGAAIMCFVYLLANWGTFYSLFFSESFVSHRTEWVYSLSLFDTLKEFIKMIFFSQYHAGTLMAAPALLLFFIIFVNYRKKYEIVERVALLYCVILAGILVGMLLKHTPIQFFISFQFDRFYFMYPSMVFILLAVSCYISIREFNKKWVYAIAIYGLLCGVIFDKELKNNAKILAGFEIEEPTFNNFYDCALFSQIQKDLDVSSNYTVKTVSIGMFPSIAEYNGFYTLDSYRVNYPVEYKHHFRKVIGRELEKDEALKKYFDNWGSRCYVFSSELMKHPKPYMCGKDAEIAVKHLDINTTVLKELGCKYVLSAVDIKNHAELGLNFIKAYTTDQSFWNIRVYMIR